MERFLQVQPSSFYSGFGTGLDDSFRTSKAELKSCGRDTLNPE